MNPELRRNLWLELSTHRLIAMPVVLTAVFILTYAFKSGSLALGDAEAASAVAHVAPATFSVTSTVAFALWAVFGVHRPPPSPPFRRIRAR